MSTGTPVSALGYPIGVEIIPECEPGLIEAIVPIDNGTVQEALSEIRGNVVAERSTLELLSEAIDQQSDELKIYARRVSRRNAIALG